MAREKRGRGGEAALRGLLLLAVAAGVWFGDTVYASSIGLGNNAPVAVDDSYGAVAGQTLSVSAPGVLSNDTDADDDSLEAELVTDVASGSLTLNSDGSFSYTPSDGFTGTDSFTYRANDGTVDSGNGTVTLTVTQASNVPVAVITATPTDGFAPLLVTFDGSGSTDPNGKAIVSYRWFFAQGQPVTTPTASTTFTYTKVGNPVAALVVVNSDGVQSLPAIQPIRVGDGQVDDPSLYLSKLSLKIDWSAHAQEESKDSMSITGYLNPAQFPDDLSSTNIVLRLNGNAVTFPIGTESSPTNTGTATFLAKVDSGTGAYTITAKTADFRNVLGVQDATSEEDLRINLDIGMNNTAILVQRYQGIFDLTYSSTEGKSAKGSYLFKSNPALAGAFHSTKTTAVEQSGGGHALTAKGVILGDLSTAPVLSAGSDLTLQVGGTSGPMLTVPYAAFKISGSGETSIYNYSASLQEVSGLKKLQINCKSRTFSLSTDELAGTGIPASTASETSTILPVTMTIPTLEGTLVFLMAVELKRSAGSGSWKR